MNWLAPAMLAGLAALAVPVLIHLLQKERRQVVEFPSLMFLRRIPQETTRRRRIRHLGLLALRCAALALLVIAFARPYLRDRIATLATARQARDIVILVDRSYSMGYGDRWTRAVAAANSAIAGLDGDDRAVLAFFDENATAATGLTNDRALLRARLTSARVGSGATRLAPALRLTRDLLAESDRARREVVLVSDFQRSAWDGAAEDVRLPAGTVLRRVDLSTPTFVDAGIAGVELTRAEQNGREALTVAARVQGSGTSAGPRAATLELNGRELARVNVDVPAGGTVIARFAPVALPPGTVRGVVRLDEDALAADDAFHFVTTRPRTLSVLVVEPSGAPARSSLFLTSALRLAHDPGYAVAVRTTDALRPADVDGRALVVLNDVAPPPGVIGQRLAAHLRRGGGLLVALGERSRRTGWAGAVAELAPLTLGEVRERGEGAPGSAGRVSQVERANAIFAPFRSAGADGLQARVLRYRELTPDAETRVLARYDDGAPALVERTAASGRVLVWTTSLDDSWTDLPLQPDYLPLLHELARHAAGAAASTPWVTVGQRVDLSRYVREATDAPSTASRSATTWLAIAPSGARTTVGPGGEDALAVAEAGVYDVRSVGDAAPSPLPLAVNVDPREGDLTPLDPAALDLAAAEGAAIAATPSVAASVSDAEREARQALWWPLLALALLLLAAEPLLANRIARRSR